MIKIETPPPKDPDAIRREDLVAGNLYEHPGLTGFHYLVIQKRIGGLGVVEFSQGLLPRYHELDEMPKGGFQLSTAKITIC